MTSTSRLPIWVSSWASTPSSSAGGSSSMMPVVAHTVAFFGLRPSANALGIAVSATATRGLGRSACTHRRSTIACSSGASAGVTSRPPIARRNSRHLRIGGVTGAELTSRTWDVVVVGAGHNGLTAAAYLARAGRSVLVLERRDRVGGACTLEAPWPGYTISPCAYLAGLLHPLVVEELALHRHGYELIPLRPEDPYITVPREDGTAFTEWIEEERT